MIFKKGVHFISKPILGGAELVALNLAKESDSVVISIFRLQKLKVEGYKIYGLFFLLKNIFFIKKTFSHTPASYLFNSFLALFLRYENIFVLHCRLNLIKRYLKVLRTTCKGKKIICISQSVLKECRKYFKSAELHLIENIPFHRVMENNNLLKEGPTKFFYIGRIATEKGILEFIKYLKESSMNNEVEIIGFGSHDEIKLLNKINYEKLKIRGWQDNPYKFIAKNDVIIIPSVSESFSLVLHEAILYGIRVYILDKTLLQNISKKESLNVILVNSFKEIHSHMFSNPPNNFVNKPIIDHTNDIKIWAARYNAL